MKNKEEPSANSQRGKRSDALSRSGLTVAARAEQPALSRRDQFLTGAALNESNIEPAFWKRLSYSTSHLR